MTDYILNPGTINFYENLYKSKVLQLAENENIILRNKDPHLGEYRIPLSACKCDVTDKSIDRWQIYKPYVTDTSRLHYFRVISCWREEVNGSYTKEIVSEFDGSEKPCIFLQGTEYSANLLEEESAKADIAEVVLEKFRETQIDDVDIVLEKYLEEVMISNFDSIFRGEGLELFKDKFGNPAQQYITDAGKIDILAFKPSTNSYVIIELKKGRASDQVVGQLLSYMQWVKEKLCQGTQNVQGLIVCREKDERLAYALRMISDKGVQARLYEISFKLKSWD